MHALNRLLATAALLVLGLVACVADPASPWEITVQMERTVPLLDGRATVAVRADDVEEPSVLLNVQCAGDESGRTLRVPSGTVTPELCGLQFELIELGLNGTEATSATFIVTWDDATEE